MFVFLTIDVESYIEDFNQAIWGDGHGLGFLVESLREFNLKGVFFVETLCASRWGFEKLEKVVDFLLSKGQDVQLHIHPEVACLPYCTFAKNGMQNYDYDSQCRMIEFGLGTFRQYGFENVTALRCGDFQANASTLKAMKTNGIHTSSNRNTDGKIAHRIKGFNEIFRIDNDIAVHEDVTDIPVTCLKTCLPFLDGDRRHLNITAISAGEMADALNKLADSGYTTCCITTHPGEMFLTYPDGTIKPNVKNQSRWVKALRLISNHEGLRNIDCREVEAIRSYPDHSPPIPQFARLHSVTRLLAQIKHRAVYRDAKKINCLR